MITWGSEEGIEVGKLSLCVVGSIVFSATVTKMSIFQNNKSWRSHFNLTIPCALLKL